MKLQALARHLNHFLEIEKISDYAPNGLQVESSRSEVHKIACAVTASLDVIAAAAEMGADALITHHGYFWKNENPLLTDMKYQRIRALIKQDIALLAYHLPLDIHPLIGNNIKLGEVLGLKMTGIFKPDGKLPLLALGELEGIDSPQIFAARCAKVLHRAPLLIEGGCHPIRKIAWCTGAAQDFIVNAKECGADAYISGEISERTFYQAKELGIHYLACGHHATERYGIQALGQWIQAQYQLSVEFVEVENPV